MDIVTALAAKVKAGDASKLTVKGHKSLLKYACSLTDPVGDRMGSLDAEIPEEGFVYIQDSYRERTAAADNCIKALRAAYRWGEKRGYQKDSPVFSVEKVHRSKGGAILWTAEDMSKFLAMHKPGSMARLWLLLSLNVLPRIGDVGGLGQLNLKVRKSVQWLEFQPSKKGSAYVAVPALPQLISELSLHQSRQNFFQTKAGNPFASSESRRNKIQDWTEQAGLPKHRTQHGVRKGAAQLLAAAGATQYEIMSLMAHTQAKISEIYTKDVERAGLAAIAIEKLARIDFENVDHAY
jgi:integrase